MELYRLYQVNKFPFLSFQFNFHVVNSVNFPLKVIFFNPYEFYVIVLFLLWRD